MSSNNIVSTESYEFKAEMKQLLNIIIHSLYTNPEVFLRELVSNASDALNKLRFYKLTENEISNPELESKIVITIDKEGQSLAIEDTGIGMSHDDLVNQLGIIARSGTAELINQFKNSNKQVDANLIGQFGVGFYSVFMVTDEVIVESKHAKADSKTYRWKSTGESGYEIEQIEDRTRGTKIAFRLKDEYKDFADDYVVKNLLKKYSNFVDFSIYVGDSKVNTVQAIWHRKKDDITKEELNEFYKFITGDYQEPLSSLHLALEGTINFKALLFIPQNAPMNMFRDFDHKTVMLYSNKIFIQDSPKEILPDYLKFVRGIVDTEELPLNVSREVTQSSPVMMKIKNVLTNKLLSHLDEMSTKEPEKYNKFFEQFGSLFKTGITQDYANKDRIVELLRFESSKTISGEFTSFNKYVSNMLSEQKEIYYISGNYRNEVENSPNMEYFKKHDIEVLYLLDPIDLFTIPYIFEYDGKRIISVEKAEITIPDSENQAGDDIKNDVIQYFKKILKDKVEDVVPSKRLVKSVASLVVGENAIDPQMEKMMKLMDKDYTASKRILEVNTNHNLLKNLAELIKNKSNSELIEDIILQIYDVALLSDGQNINTSEFSARTIKTLLHITNNNN